MAKKRSRGKRCFGVRIDQGEQPPLLTKSQAAEWLGIPKELVKKGIERGELRTFSFGDREWVPLAELQRLAHIR